MEAPPATKIDGINFATEPHVNCYSWVQREFTRLCQKNAQLMIEERAARARKRNDTGETTEA